MKKLIASLLLLVMIMGTCVMSYAENSDELHWNDDGNGNATLSFKLRQTQFDPTSRNWINGGTAIITVRSASRVAVHTIQTLFAYGQQTGSFSVSIGASFSPEPSIGITFSPTSAVTTYKNSVKSFVL